MEKKYKRCPYCGRILTLDNFYKDRSCKDGLHIYCKECTYEFQKKSIKKRAEKLNCEVIINIPKSIPGKEKNPSEKSSLRRVKSLDLLSELKRRGYVWENLYMRSYVEYSKI